MCRVGSMVSLRVCVYARTLGQSVVAEVVDMEVSSTNYSGLQSIGGYQTLGCLPTWNR